MIAAILLAAGSARRFGSQKLVALLDGEPLVRHAARALVSSGIDDLYVVTGSDADRVREALTGVGIDARFVHCAAYASGMAASLGAGLSVLPAGTDAAVIALGDQPGLDPRVVGAIIDAYHDSSPLIAAPRYRGQLANPVLFSRVVFPELLALTGDVGARGVVLRDPSRVRWVDVNAPVPWDVDEREELRGPDR